MIITWLGHSCFFLEGKRGLSLLLDPFHEDEVGYGFPPVRADIVLISHDHRDHNNALAAGKDAEVIFSPGEYTRRGMEILGIESCHDADGGRMRGTNTIFCFELDGIRVCHLGDLGHALSRCQIDAIGAVDLLFLPVGGRYTIDAAGANKVMRQLHPAVAVPMHYKTRALSFDLDPVDDFLKGRRPADRQERLILDEMNHSRAVRPGEESRVVLLGCPGAEGARRSID
ncbi:MAG: metal-dependent hydrolase [Methanosaeta sp. PtaU1.Bin112]|nr:MAG: metal-dependent hydrolase [Methanosaeta sp. PtaU1.Bin112]